MQRPRLLPPNLRPKPPRKLRRKGSLRPEDPITIGIIQLTEHAALDAAREGFVQALADNGYVDGDKIKIDFQNAQNDQSTLSTISDRFVSEEVDLVLAIATPAAQAVAGKTTEIPILATAVTDFVVAKLAEPMKFPAATSPARRI